MQKTEKREVCEYMLNKQQKNGIFGVNSKDRNKWNKRKMPKINSHFTIFLCAGLGEGRVKLREAFLQPWRLIS